MMRLDWILRGGTVPSQISWDKHDPMVIKIIYGLGQPNAKTWLFGRDLIQDAFAKPFETQGADAVRWLYANGEMRLTLEGDGNIPGCTMSLCGVRRCEQFRDFVASTYKVVPREYFDADLLLSQLLAPPA